MRRNHAYRYLGNRWQIICKTYRTGKQLCTASDKLLRRIFLVVVGPRGPRGGGHMVGKNVTLCGDAHRLL